ncbi:MAG: TRAP transporter small permease subunit [Syntrophales bacterium]
MEKMIIFYETKLEKWGIYLISAPLLLMTLIEVLNAVGRKLFMPFPCSLEAVESLLVISVYLGVAIVALEGGHINVALLTDRFSAATQHGLDAFANFLGTLTFGFLAFGAWKEAFRALGIWEMRIGVYRFPLWPFKLVFALGMTMLAVQLAVNVVKCVQRARGKHDYAKSKQEDQEKLLMQA